MTSVTRYKLILALPILTTFKLFFVHCNSLPTLKDPLSAIESLQKAAKLG